MSQPDSAGLPQDPAALHRMLAVFWAAFLGSVVLYAVLGFFLGGMIGASDLPESQPYLPMVLGILAVSSICAASAVRLMLMKPIRRPAPWTEYASAEIRSRIVQLGLAESAGIVGLVICLLGYPYWKGWFGFGPALVFIPMSYPTRAAIENAWSRVR